LRVIYELSKVDAIRFGELKKNIDNITNTMLTSTLRNLEENKIVNRVQYNEIPPHVEYSLTDIGRDMYPIFIEMVNWSVRHM
ncbi:MAG: winged helix-turn-helix transcriptional regulator, partial [Lachnospirales bacterium]